MKKSFIICGNIIAYTFSIFFILAGLVYLGDSILGGLLILLGSILVLPIIRKLAIKRLAKIESILIGGGLTCLGIVLVIIGLVIYSNTPSTIARLDQQKKIAQEEQQKKDDENAVKAKQDEEQKVKQKQDEADATAKKAQQEKQLKDEQDKQDRLKTEGDEFTNQVSIIAGENGFWFKNKNSQPFQVINLYLNYNDLYGMEGTGDLAEYAYPQGFQLNEIRKHQVKKDAESEVFFYRDFVEFRNEKRRINMNLVRVISVHIQGKFQNDKGETNEFEASYNVS